MPRTRRDAAPLKSERRIRKAVAALQTPTDAMLLDKNVLAASRQIQRILSRGKSGTTEVRRVLAELAAKDQGVPVLKEPGLASGIIGRIPSMSQALSGLYLPVNTPDLLVPPARRYFAPRVTTTTLSGSGYAYSQTGKLETIQMVNLAATSESAWAEFSILLPTNRSRYGAISRITFQADIAWNAHHYFTSDFVWNQRLDGYVWLYSDVWLDAFVLDPSTVSFVRISTGRVPLLQSTWYINEGGESANSGSLNNGAATLQFTASSPPQTFLLRVLCRSMANHNIRNVDGQPIAAPQSGQFIAYGLTKADVPDMWVTYEVLAT